MRLLEAIIWDQEEGLNLLLQANIIPNGRLLIYPISPPAQLRATELSPPTQFRVAELTPTQETAGGTQPEPAVSPGEVTRVGDSGREKGFGFEAGTNFPALSATTGGRPRS